MSDKVIVLASGGLDSTLVMSQLLRQGHHVVPFFCDYNQYSLEGERRAVETVTSLLKEDYESLVEDIVVAKVDVGIPRVAACPGRIHAFVGAASIWAFTKGWTSGKIAIGIHKGDKDVDSCRVGYEEDLNKTLKILTQDCLQIITPLMGMSRQTMAEELEGSGVPWGEMYNCYWGVSCGYQSKDMHYRCPGCRRKAEAMQLVGRPESEWKIPNRPPQGGLKITRRDWNKWV